MEKVNSCTYEDLYNKVSQYIKSEDELKEIKRAYDFACEAHTDQTRLTGEKYIVHPLNVALILTEIYADSQTIVTALLHDVINFTDITLDDIEQNFGPEIKKLVDGISRINKLSLSADNDQLASYYKKILVGLSGDVRIIILKIADRLHNMRTLWALSETKRKAKAKETLEILVPIAHRLGINHIKSELEDLCLMYYKPDVYNDILEKLSEERSELDKYVNEMMHSVSKILSDNNINHEMKGRTKSVYSIYNKLNNGKSFNEIYDILALRYLVNTEAECYLALGLIHAKFKPVPRRFKDYIARPKENGYQSLHTTVFGVGGRLYEIQIRTHDMDRIAEYGFASHWSYKEHGEVRQNMMEEKLKSFRSIIELNEQQASNEDFVNTVKNEIFSSNNIYVYTPKGDIIELPDGSTPIDFAYRVHTSVGHTMVGAIVNNNIVPLDYKLKDGEIVKVNTNKNSKGPSKEWINIAFSSSTKNKIKSFFNKIDKDEMINSGKDSLIRAIRKKKMVISDVINEKNLQRVYDELSLNSENELYYEIGIGKQNPTSVIKILLNIKKNDNDILQKLIKNNKILDSQKGDIIIDGISDIKVTYGGCCTPVKGDNIIGYISKGNGITIHRNNCHNISDMSDRIINVSWNDDSTRKYVANIIIYTVAKEDLLLDIITKTTSSNITIRRVNTINNNDYYTYDIDILIEDSMKLNNYMNIISSIQGISSVERGNK